MHDRHTNVENSFTNKQTVQKTVPRTFIRHRFADDNC